MTIASQIKASYTAANQNTGRETYDHDGIFSECEEKAISTEQDYDAESTTYEFADGSVIVSCNGEYNAYGSKQ